MGYFGHEMLVWVEILSIFGIAVFITIFDTVEWDRFIEQDKSDLVRH